MGMGGLPVSGEYEDFLHKRWPALACPLCPAGSWSSRTSSTCFQYIAYIIVPMRMSICSSPSSTEVVSPARRASLHMEVSSEPPESFTVADPTDHHAIPQNHLIDPDGVSSLFSPHHQPKRPSGRAPRPVLRPIGAGGADHGQVRGALAEIPSGAS